jgi:hypothetical protein
MPVNAIELLHPCDGTTCKTFDSTQEAIDRMQVSRTSIANAITDGLPMKGVVVVELKVHPQGPSGVVFTAQGLNTDVRCKITLPVAWRPSVHVPAADMHTRRKLAKFGLWTRSTT